MVANELIYHFTDVILQRHETTGGLRSPRHYRPQRSWGKVMFLHVSVILFKVGREDWEDNPWADTPHGRHPRQISPHRGQTSLLRSACWDTVNKRAVRILLECNLVFGHYSSAMPKGNRVSFKFSSFL